MKAVVVALTGLSLTFGSASAMADDGFAQKLLGKAMQLIGVKYRLAVPIRKRAWIAAVMCNTCTNRRWV